MKKLKCVAASLAVLLSLNCQVWGANAYNAEAEYDPANSLVTVSGNVGAENSGKSIQMFVLKPYEAIDENDTKTAYTLSDLTSETASDIVFALRQSTVDENGGFLFEYKWNEKMVGGNFQYKFAVQGDASSEEDRTYEKYFMGETELEENLLKFSTNSVEEMIDAIEQEHLALNVDDEFYASNKKAVAQKFIDLMNDRKPSVETMKTGYKDLFDTAVFYGKAGEGKLTADDVVSYCDRNGIELPEEYIGTEEEKGCLDAIVKLINANKIPELLSDSELLTAMAEYNVLAKVNEAGRSELSDVIDKYSEELGIEDFSEFDYYSKLSDDEKIKANIPLAKADFITIEDFGDAFRDAVDSYKDSLKESNKKPSGGGGSRGGSSSTISAPTLDIKPVEKAETVYKKTFDDIDGVEWAREAIENFAAKGFVNGKTENKFAPNADITRAEFVKILVNVMNIPENAEAAELTFTDCDSNDWYYDFVKKAVGAGIVNGVSETEFGADALITRQDMCVMVQRAAAFKGLKLAASEMVEFADGADISDYALESVELLAGAKVINGKGDNKFEPKSRSTRAEAVVILHRLDALKK